MIEFDPVLVHEWLRRSARRMPEKDAIVCGDERWSYKKLDVYSDRFAEMLGELGVGRQDRVVICTGNRAETVVSLYGTLKAGGIFVVLDGGTRSRRLGQVIEDSTARVIVARSDQAAVVRDAVAKLEVDLKIIWIGKPPKNEGYPGASNIPWDSVFSPLSQEGHPVYEPVADRLPRTVDVDLACLIYTSGTTGRPKGVMCSHRNMISAAKSIIQYLGNRPDDIILNVLPLSFGYGLYQVLMSVMFGGTVVLENSFLYPHLVLKRIAEEKASAFPLVPSMAAMMLRIDAIGEYDFSTLRYITSAGAALPVSHLRSLRQLIPQAKLFNMYGLTECVRVCYLAGEELDQRPASVGRPISNCEVLIVDENGNEVEPGNAGELLVRGPNVMQGYWNDSELTAGMCRPGPYPASRWLRTGDQFRKDEDGFLHFVCRKDDMIKTRGERVSPKEVEEVVCEVSGVAEAAAIGVPDNVLGQAIKVFLVSCNGNLEMKTILRHCASRLESFMVPKYVEFMAALPKTANGKINRRELQAIGEK